MVNSLVQGISPTVLAVTLAVLTGGLLLIIIGLGVSDPVLWRMGLRNMIRRPSQTLILLCGLALSTVVITASFGLQDSFNDSAVTQRLARMGNVDESVTGPFTRVQLASALTRIRHNREVQAATAIILNNDGVDVSSSRTGLTAKDNDVYAVPPNFDQVYGPITDIHGQPVHFADLRPNEMFVSATLAQYYDVRPGDTLQLSGSGIIGTVRALLSKDLGVTTGEAGADSTPEIILPLSTYQQVIPDAPNTICIKNIGQGGLDDIGPGGSRSQAVVRFLQHLFPGAPASLNVPGVNGPVDFNTLRIHPLKPDVMEETRVLSINKGIFFSPVGQQFSWLPPLFTCLLIGAGMLLLVLLLILLAAERRVELGMSRALGLQRHHLVQLLLFEGCGYGMLAALAGVLLGIGATALELAVLSYLPQLSPGESVGNALPVPVIGSGSLHVWLSWQSALSAWCLSVLATVITVLLTALWISRTTIVMAMHDLDDPPRVRASLPNLMRTLWTPPLEADGQPLPETFARRLSRKKGAVSGVLWGLWVRGPLCLLLGGILLALVHTQGQGWIEQLAIALLIAGVGLLVGWLLLLITVPPELARRLGFSLIGVGWLFYGLRWGNAFLGLFQAGWTGFFRPPSSLEILYSMLLPLVGAVILVMTNADLLTLLITALFIRVRGLAAVSRTSLVYPLTFRFRTGVTVALLSLVTFLVLLLVTTNLGAIQAAQQTTTTGGFQLEVDLDRSEEQSLAPRMQELRAHTTLQHDFAAVGLFRFLHFPGDVNAVRLLLPGRPLFPMLEETPRVVDDEFLSSTTMPMFARAQGFTSDRQVWNAVKDHVGYAVLRYDGSIPQLPRSDGFVPFDAEVHDSSGTYHRVTIIGIVPASTPWQTLYLSTRTAAGIDQPPYTTFMNFYVFQLRPGVSEAQAAGDLSRAIDAGRKDLAVRSLDHTAQGAITAVFTLFLAGDLALGLLFGALAIGVIASRAVVERRQQIGMLRALGFSRTLVRRSFLLECSFVITLSLLIGTALALWLAYQVARALYLDFPLPLLPIALILLGCSLTAFASTALPAHRAASLHPAEALRYE